MVEVALCEGGTHHGWLVGWDKQEYWSDPSKWCPVSSYVDSTAGLDQLNSLPEVTLVARNGGGALDTKYLVADDQWDVGLALPECPSKRITCRVNYRREDITKGSVWVAVTKSKVKLPRMWNGVWLWLKCTVSSVTSHQRYLKSYPKISGTSGFVRGSEKPNECEWESPYFAQPKPKTNLGQFLSDFRNLNRQIKRKPYMMPKIIEMLL